MYSNYIMYCKTGKSHGPTRSTAGADKKRKVRPRCALVGAVNDGRSRRRATSVSALRPVPPIAPAFCATSRERPVPPHLKPLIRNFFYHVFYSSPLSSDHQQRVVKGRAGGCCEGRANRGWHPSNTDSPMRTFAVVPYQPPVQS